MAKILVLRCFECQLHLVNGGVWVPEATKCSYILLAISSTNHRVIGCWSDVHPQLTIWGLKKLHHTSIELWIGDFPAGHVFGHRFGCGKMWKNIWKSPRIDVFHGFPIKNQALLIALPATFIRTSPFRTGVVHHVHQRSGKSPLWNMVNINVNGGLKGFIGIYREYNGDLQVNHV